MKERTMDLWLNDGGGIRTSGRFVLHPDGKVTWEGSVAQKIAREGILISGTNPPPFDKIPTDKLLYPKDGAVFFNALPLQYHGSYFWIEPSKGDPMWADYYAFYHSGKRPPKS